MTQAPTYNNEQLDRLNPKEFIIIKKARVHNLKNLSIAIPRNNLIVITGLSGSGKSSLAFDTLFKEGQRMYVESLSAYARQFLGRMEKPDVDYIRGVCPAIALEQKVSTHNSRSTVGTTTEIYDYLKLLFARIGKTYSPKSNQEVKKDTVDGIMEIIHTFREGTKMMISCPIKKEQQRTIQEELYLLLSKGFARVLINGKVRLIEDMAEEPDEQKKNSDIELLVDRSTLRGNDKGLNAKLSDSIETAFFEGEGCCYLHVEGEAKRSFSDRFELDGISFVEPSTHLFNFNSPYGVCKNCEGFGKVLAFDEGLVVPDKTLSVAEGAIAPWRGQLGQKWLTPLRAAGVTFPTHLPYEELKQSEKELLWNGYKDFKGIAAFFKYLNSKTYKIQYRVLLSRYRRRTTCPECQGTRLRKDVRYIKINNKSIVDLLCISLEEVADFLKTITLNDHEQGIAKRIIKEIRERVNCVNKLGLQYLTLNRLTSTLSGGEYQRIKLATALGSPLVGSMYIMDEPTIGLHPKDIARVMDILKALRDAGNTVLVVEHEEEVMKAANQIVDIGPEAGTHGGNLIFQGTFKDLLQHAHSHTANYLTGKEKIPIPKQRREGQGNITLTGAKEHNLKNLTVKFPLQAFSAVTGVSGSGKSTLIKNILIPAIQQDLGLVTAKPGRHHSLEGVKGNIDQVEFIDQHPIGKSSRSNPISYVKAYDGIRDLFSKQPLSRRRAYKPAFFSFNIDGGRCEKCQGEGVIKIEMQFVANVFLTCEDCGGSRFKKEILEVTYQKKNITDVLNMTVENALIFFKDEKTIYEKIKPLFDVGLGYVKLGQSSNSLSGGEAQRVKLASFLSRKKAQRKSHILFVFDEPTTGLHCHDINRLVQSLNALIDEGHSVIVIEHNIELIKCADWVIDLGPEGGEKKGGQLLFMGAPEELIKNTTGYTGRFLEKKLTNLL